jgi:hypothetical protein
MRSSVWRPQMALGGNFVLNDQNRFKAIQITRNERAWFYFSLITRTRPNQQLVRGTQFRVSSTDGVDRRFQIFALRIISSVRFLRTNASNVNNSGGHFLVESCWRQSDEWRDSGIFVKQRNVLLLFFEGKYIWPAERQTWENWIAYPHRWLPNDTSVWHTGRAGWHFTSPVCSCVFLTWWCMSITTSVGRFSPPLALLSWEPHRVRVFQ